MKRILNLIDGELVPPAGSAYLPNLEPATGAAYSEVPDGDGRDVERAVQAAEAAFPAWSRTPAAERSRLLVRVADLIEAHQEALARAESIDTGKPIAMARSLDIPRGSSNFRFFATSILHFHSESHATDDRAINYTLRRPRGVAGIISPWNLPLYLLSWKVAPALAVGNTVVAKPSEVTPMTAFLLSEICREAGLPKGVLNIVHGTGAKVGAALVSHPRVGTISFTGGTKTGREIAAACAPNFKKVALELGGKNPNIIFADAPWEEMIPGSVKSSFDNQGQICLSGSRIFVERPALESFLERFTARAKALKLGDPLEDGTEMGAVVSPAQRDKAMAYLDLARQEGGRVLCGGGPPAPVSERCRGGFFIQPTVITGLSPESRVNQEEIFGPIVTITPFDSEEEVVGWANGTTYGLSASIWTQNLSRAHRMAEKIQSGTVWINCWMVRDLRVPFGGMKQSGVGREGGLESLRFFTEPKNVCVRVPLDA
ncbi:MAG TPA: aldehyde dehydrogenase [Candidatus Polarisedimenticolia bacterium]|nr:aldehyde dehydrogenase [Candidatus Polarisedimenticolia bacterium]